jgi:hypothetical protein
MKPDESLEHHEHLEHTAHGGEHGHGNASNKRIAILIAALAAILAIVESGGKAAQTEVVTSNINASDTWSFYQAKTIRSTILRTSSAMLETVLPDAVSPDKAAKVGKQLGDWKDAADRYDSDPKSGEGRKELMGKAKVLEARRDHAMNALHNFEYGAAALQLGIVLASASVITGMPVLAATAAVLGGLGAVLGSLGWIAPELLHHLMAGGHEGGHPPGAPPAGH